MASFNETTTRISIECVDNPDEFPGVVVYGVETFPISSYQGRDAIEWTASDDGLGRHSSVRPFQSAHYETEDTATDLDPPETDSDSLARLEEEKKEEEGEEDDTRHLQPYMAN